MITPNRLETALYKLINIPEVLSQITGEVQKGRKNTVRAGDGKQDIVIASLSDGAGQLQEGFVNVNIYCPDIHFLVDGVDQYEQDGKSLDRISDVVIPLIDDVYTEGVLFWIDDLKTFEVPNLNEHYLNLKVRFGHPNY